MTKAEFAQRALMCQDKLFRMAYLSLRSYADCQDAVQEALLKAWAKRDSLKHEEYFDTWLIRILLNVIKDQCRRSARRQLQPLVESQSPDIEPLNTDLRDAVRALDEKLRTPLLLKYISGYSVDETARMLHITPAQVRWRLEVGKKRLKEQLGDKEEGI